MTEEKRLQRNQDRLDELFPTFRIRIDRLIKELQKDSLRPRIQEAFRSPEDQLKAFETGHSKLNSVFTT